MVKKILILIIDLLCIASIAYAGCEVRFFQVMSDQATGHEAIILPEGDVLPLAKLRNVSIVYDDLYKIIKVILTPSLIKDISEFTGLDDPLSIESVQALGLTSYRGETYTDDEYSGLFYYHPDLEGTKIIGTDPDTGEYIRTWKVRRVKASCE